MVLVRYGSQSGVKLIRASLFVDLSFRPQSSLVPIYQRIFYVCYPPQLKNYEQAVIEKRFSELEEEEVDALLDEVNEQ